MTTTLKQEIEVQLLEHCIGYDRLDRLVKRAEVRLAFPELIAIVGFGDGVHHKDLWAHTRQVVAQAAQTASQRWAALFHDIGKPRCFRIHEGEVTFHNHECVGADMFRSLARRTRLWDDERSQADEIEWLIRNSGRIESVYEWTDSAVRRLMTETGPRLPALIRFVRADVTTASKVKYANHQKRLDYLECCVEKVKKIDADRNILPKGLGLVVAEHLGIEPGPELGDAIEGIRMRVLRGELERCREIEYYIENL